MAYLTNELIAGAFYASSIISREYETPSASQMSEGLFLLNDLIGDKAIDSSLIPYSDNHTFTAVAGTDNYYIENLISIETFVFYIDGVRYQTNNQQRFEFFGTFRPMNVQSLPWNWHLERELDGARLFLYFVPDVNYPLEIWGQFRLLEVTLFQDLSLTLDRFYINFLKFELALRLCAEYSYSVPPFVQQQYNKYYQMIDSKSNTMDLRQRKITCLTGNGGINWGWINLGYTGWMPTSS